MIVLKLEEEVRNTVLSLHRFNLKMKLLFYNKTDSYSEKTSADMREYL